MLRFDKYRFNDSLSTLNRFYFPDKTVYAPRMEKLGDVIRAQRKALGMSQAQLGAELGYSQTVVSDWESGKVTQIRNYGQLARVLQIDPYRMEALMAAATAENPDVQRINPKIRDHIMFNKTQIMQPSVANAENIATNILALRATVPNARNVPVYGRAQGGDGGVFEFNGEVMGWEHRPAVLEGVNDAYAVYVDGASMYPRYKPGETVWVNPNRPPRREDDVIVQIMPDDGESAPRGFIKEFVGWAGNFLVVRQHNPAIEIKYPRETVKSVHIIVFSQRSG